MPNSKRNLTPTSLFQRFVPAQAVEFCVELHRIHNFEFRVKKPRQSKLGDYRYDPQDKSHTITINNDLKPFSFLITYVHEVAHLVTVKKYGNRIAHHGKEWKNEYSLLLHQALQTGAFPPTLEKELIQFARSPKASTAASAKLVSVLKTFENTQTTLLSEIQNHQKFTFRNEEFIKLEKRRTRSLCVRVSDNKKFLISEIAEVNQ